MNGAADDDTSPSRVPSFGELMRRRWSCRAFRPEPIPRETIADILAVAQHAPSWCNTQPWQVVITSGDETARFAAALRAAAEGSAGQTSDVDWPTYGGRYLDRRREVGWMLYEAVGVERGDREAAARQASENLRFFGAPHVALVTTDRALGPYGLLDCGSFVQSFLLAAQSLDVATIPQAAIAAYSPAVRRHFGLAEDRMVVCAISFGRADRAHPANGFRAPRAGMEDVVEWRG